MIFIEIPLQDIRVLYQGYHVIVMVKHWQDGKPYSGIPVSVATSRKEALEIIDSQEEPENHITFYCVRKPIDPGVSLSVVADHIKSV